MAVAVETLTDVVVVYQSGYAIFGWGRNLAEAIEDAESWGGRDLEPVRYIPPGRPAGGETNGGMYWAPATRRLVVAVMERGGDVPFRFNEAGLLDLAA